MINQHDFFLQILIRMKDKTRKYKNIPKIFLNIYLKILNIKWKICGKNGKFVIFNFDKPKNVKKS